MDRVKTAFEKAMEKIEAIAPLSAEEKEEMKDREKIRSVLAEFYRGDIKKDQIGQSLKGTRPALLKEAQQNMADSMRLNNVAEEFDQRRWGILAIETLKPKQNTAAVESVLTSISRLQKEYGETRDRAIREVRAAVEQNPQLRVRPVKSPDGRTIMASLTVEEAMQERLGDFFIEHENKYGAMFAKAVQKLKSELK